ncbi:mannosyl-glycoprotein endo-beta-N-acetylglucosaminidase [Spizellomyces sp. 'palustris']|nr:mannosyl-glycoprotein endo-beta-N-acetylglucosaminidase [Spizellomyces sp. 'palustris']
MSFSQCADSHLPRTRPFTSLAALAEWSPGTDEFNVAAVKLRPRPCKSDERPEKVICVWELNKVQDFSHWRITIPPPGWTNAAHRNGIQVLGTFITEWDEGVQENYRLLFGPAWEKGSEGAFDPYFADKLVQVAQYYGFDGWFFNIESPVDKPDDSHVMIEFLEYITRKMHEALPGSLVIWYDSLTTEGKIDWQDRVTDLNKPFFDVTDGIFTNYTWKPSYPDSSALVAGNRKRAVYTGIDVWGRNSFGGGRFSVHKALRVICRAETSCAIFAPGWCWEGFDRVGWEERERKFWCDPSVVIPDAPEGSVDENDMGCVADYIRKVSCPGQDWFYTDFDRGFGASYWVDGLLVSTASWINHSRQTIPPSYRTDSVYPIALNLRSRTIVQHPNPATSATWDVCGDVTYTGGSSVGIQVLGDANGQIHDEFIPAWMFRLFKLGIEVRRDMRIEAVCLGPGMGIWIRTDDGHVKVVMSDDEEGWRTIGVDCQVLSSSKWIVEVGIVVLACQSSPSYASSVFSSSSFSYDGSSKLATKLGTSTSCTELHVGSMRIYTPCTIPDLDGAPQITFQSPSPTPNGTYITAIWMPDASVDRWEVYIDNKWIGCAFVNMYRSVHFETSRVGVAVKGYDGVGRLVACRTGLFPSVLPEDGI